MSDESQEKFHEYDGIIEHDNPLPTWWLWTFFITIIFAFLYYIHYELGNGETLTKELSVAMAELEKSKGAQPTAALLESEETIAAAFKEADIVKLGAEQFAAKCASCHGAELQGLIGPNLVDKYWIHGQGTRMDVVKVIREGVADKGMPPWGTILKKNELYAVAAYIMDKKGSNPQNPKAPQGQIVEGY